MFDFKEIWNFLCKEWHMIWAARKSVAVLLSISVIVVWVVIDYIYSKQIGNLQSTITLQEKQIGLYTQIQGISKEECRFLDKQIFAACPECPAAGKQTVSSKCPKRPAFTGKTWGDLAKYCIGLQALYETCRNNRD